MVIPVNPKPCISCSRPFVPVSGPQKACVACKAGTCRQCGKQFEKRYKGNVLVGIFCSQPCQSADRITRGRLNVACGFCGKPLWRTRGSLRRKPVPFCNNSCKAKKLWSIPEHSARVSRAMKANPYHTSDAKRAQLDLARPLIKYGPEMRDKLRAARLKQKFPTRMTSIEQALHDAFAARTWVFEMHASLFGRWQPDFAFHDSRVIVQADGEYWHSRPGQPEKDAAFDAAATEAGWLVIRLPGKRIKRHLAECLAEVETAMHSRRTGAA
jgi:very-short-patch-repair endonuclease